MCWRLAKSVYNGLMGLALPFFFVRLWIKGVQYPPYRHRWLERLGIFKAPPCPTTYWVHAVSVGEALSAVQLVQKIWEGDPLATVVFTTTTPTGSQRVQAAFQTQMGKTLFHYYFPFDISICVRSFLRKTSPSVLILMETELWPNVLSECKRAKIPVMIANGRLSSKSMNGYLKVKSLLAPMLESIKKVATQSAQDSQRFETLGIPAHQIVQTGNIKFDVCISPSLSQEVALLKQLIDDKRPVWIAASTHEHEETQVLEAHRHLLAVKPDLLLVLVPRHPNRFKQVAKLCEQQGFTVTKRSERTPCASQIFLGDSMGELMSYYGISDVAFVGGSLVQVGGHNLLEPALLGLPIISGPHLFNFSAISKALQQHQAMKVVHSSLALAQCVQEMFLDETQQHQMGQRALALVENNKGALVRLNQEIQTLVQNVKSIDRKR